MPIVSTARRTRTTRATTVAALLLAGVAAGACSSGSSTAAGGATSTSGVGSASTSGTGPSTSGTGGGAGTTAPSGGTVQARYAGFTSDVYEKDENWVCRAGKADDLCETVDLDVTHIAADGTTEVEKVERPAEHPVDCFYVYPTVNFGPDPADEAMASDDGQEVATARNQLARYSTLCDVYAPLYRQITFAGFGATNGDELRARAYQDVRDAFSYYMANWNEGRPFVLIGHSQGSGVLLQLMKDELDGTSAVNVELRERLVSAILGGGRTEVPAGEDVGASFTDIPLCRTDTENACVVAFNTVVEGSPDIARWGSAGEGNERACTNPGALDGGKAPITPIMSAQGEYAPGITVETPWVQVEGLLQAECVTADGLTTLQVTPVGEAGDRRDPAQFTQESAGWGLHITEMNVLLRDLLDLVQTQSASFG